jgi:hypothetical protein
LPGSRRRSPPARGAGQSWSIARQDRLVPAADLVPAEALTDAEEAEYRRLDAQLAGTIGEARTLKRFNGLRLRSLMFGTAL